jgi:dephospho-CoA kinase
VRFNGNSEKQVCSKSVGSDGTIRTMRIFGLTGNIGSGKSTVAAMLRDAGIPVLDADRISKEVTAPGGRAYDAVVQAFGKGIVRDDGSIDRKRLGEIVFSDPASRERLEWITHPAILEAMKEEIAGIERKGHRAAVVEATLIHETGRKGLFDAVISVTCDRETAISRLAARDGMSRGQAEARLRAQMDADQKAEASDYVIDNSSSTEETSRQVNRIARILLGNE